MTNLRVLSVAALFVLARSPEANAFLSRHPVEVSVEVVVNAVDGPPRSECRESERIENPRRNEWWVAFADTKPLPETQREGAGAGIRCGKGSFERATWDAEGALGAPRLIAQVSTRERLSRQMEDERVLEVMLSISLRRLTGLDEGGEPIYERSDATRELFFSDPQDVFVPLLVANDVEREALGIHEVFVRIAASRVAKESGSAYGVLVVTSGEDEADLLLDGGVVGRTSAGGETTLRNVPVGLRDVRLRDASGEETRKLVRVEADRVVLADLAPVDAEEFRFPLRLEPLGENAQGYEEYRRAADGAVVVEGPAGEFLMGNAATERNPLEHRVYVSDFLMDKTGVTWGQFKKLAEAMRIPLPEHEPYWGIHDDHPVVYVSWEDAAAYCEWVGGRLPTEAEREKAARGADERKYPWGDEEPDPERAVFRRSWGYEATGAVGTHPAGMSPYGLHDMGGNVWEWCSDWYDDGYYAVSPDRDPQGPPSGRAHVVRGGSWDSRPTVLSASCRSWGHRGYRDGDFGFRCAMNAPR
ncbi:MAG: formylglycine-generating enzyme family protein [Planctomycetota bacterium]